MKRSFLEKGRHPRSGRRGRSLAGEKKESLQSRKTKNRVPSRYQKRREGGEPKGEEGESQRAWERYEICIYESIENLFI